MSRIKNLLPIGAVSLVTLINSCSIASINDSFQDKPASKSSPISQPESNPLSQPLASRKYRQVEIITTCFSDYKPLLSKTPVNISEKLAKYLEEGFDYDDNGTSSIQIAEYVKFEKFIYEEARRLGYTEAQVQQCSPREAGLLACDIVAKNTNYAGVTLDFKTKRGVEKRLGDLDKSLDEVLISPGSSDKEKELAKKGLDAVKKIRELQKELIIYEDKVADLPGTMMRKYDHIPVDQLIMEEMPIICRHYTKITKGIFEVLKTKNEKLKNTFVATYSLKNHVFLQMATVHHVWIKDVVELTFFDPTWYDISGNVEGYNSFHFEDPYHLKKQLEAVIKKIAEEGTTTQPSENAKKQ